MVTFWLWHRQLNLLAGSELPFRPVAAIQSTSLKKRLLSRGSSTESKAIVLGFRGEGSVSGARVSPAGRFRGSRQRGWKGSQGRPQAARKGEP